MKTTEYVCKSCGREFGVARTVYDGDRRLQGCPGCNHCGAEIKVEANMNKETLGQYIFLKRELQSEEERLSKLRARGEECVELYELIENNRLRVMAKLLKVQTFIYSIDDSFIRQVFVQRYINGLTWAGIATALGGYYSADYVRIAHDRFLKEKK